MKILHTADWHLGQGFYERDRLQEQRAFIDFLLDFIEREKVDLLIIAGDVFDTANPARAAEQLYYDFIARLCALRHCELVVVGGNHDSAAHLEAPKRLLKSLRVHVVGSLPEDLSQAVLRFECGGRRLCVAAIPFLRDRDVRRAVEGESFDEMEARTKAGIARVYKDMAELVLADKREGEILLATGHLTAVGGRLSDSERSVHIGNLGSIGAQQLSPGFDYVALGHLHHPQVVGGDECIRYSGSPIPLSFSESLEKQMRLLTITEENQLEQQAVKVPLARRLIRMAGSLDEVLAEIAELKIGKEELCPWIEVMLSEGEVNPSINDQIREAAAKQGAEVCKVSRKGSVARLDPVDGEVVKSINEWKPEAVFAQRIENYEGDVDKKTLTQCFQHVLDEVG
ncbi:MAG: exonuclease SbcCD subunit D C-terminal domain-containing protein [Verrucomicrobiales bacterium]|nr:exonuclease SbcCD subunit D C-terminal domain-containing protein [Verrucomicrobiales bacterium]